MAFHVIAGGFAHEDHAHFGLPGGLASCQVKLQVVGWQVGERVRSLDRAGRDRCRGGGLCGSLPAGPVLSAGLVERGACGARRAGSAPAWWATASSG